MATIDQLRLNFSQEGLLLLNIVLGIVMYGIALDIKGKDFKGIIRSPKGPIIGLVAQFFLLPAFTFFLTMIIQPQPSIALGMILVAACPGGNVSNFITHLSRGNTALSITMTAISTSASLVMTPFNIWFWGTLNPNTAPIYKEVMLDPVDMFATIFTLLGVPLFLGLLTQKKFPEFANKAAKHFKHASVFVFMLFVLVALQKNWEYFMDYVGFVVVIVFIHNASAILLGYLSSRAMKMDLRDAKAVAIEVGIQNSGLGLILVFNFFDGMGGMALVAAWWGIWHLISGLALSAYWAKKDNLELASLTA